MDKMEKIRTYKGFDKDLRCKGFQYEVGKEYKEENIEICKKGFHACESPMEVWDHYDMLDSRYCEVEQSGDLQRENNTTKICSSRIKIIAELKLSDIIKIGVEWILNKTSPKNVKAGNNSGDYAKIGSSGYSAKIGSSGDYAQIGSSGDSAKIGSSGYSAKIGSSGYYAQIGSSGYSAQIGSSGYSAQIGSSGDYAKIGSTGEDCVICCAGNNSIAKAKVGSWITLSEWVYDNSKNRLIPKCVKTEYVDGERIKGDTWYKLVDGEFKEV